MSRSGPTTSERDHRDFVRSLVSEDERKRYRHCPYCGRPCHGPACDQHRDLVEVERALLEGLRPHGNVHVIGKDEAA